MTVINATPHDITILASDLNVSYDQKTKTYSAIPELVEVLATLPKSGILPRVEVKNTPAADIDGYPVQSVEYGEIIDLPAEVYGTYYICSGIVAAAAAKIGRQDVLAPGALVRDASNPSAVIRCLFLQRS